jgi:hypothetical protein
MLAFLFGRSPFSVKNNFLPIHVVWGQWYIKMGIYKRIAVSSLAILGLLGELDLQK